MHKIAAQIKQGCLVPYSEPDEAAVKSFYENQIVRVAITGIEKERSYPQLKAFWSGCKLVSENTDDLNWNTKDKTAMQIKVILKFIDMTRSIVSRDGTVCLSYRSISYAELPHMEACGFFTEAFNLMALKLGMEIDDFLAELGVEL